MSKDTVNFKYSALWKRGLAGLVDFCFYLFVFFILTSWLEVGQLLYTVIFWSSFLLYFTLMESSKLQATVGKLIFRIYVIDKEGNKVSFLGSVVRNLTKVLSTISFLIGWIIVLFTKHKQTLHDKISSSLVISGEFASEKEQLDYKRQHETRRKWGGVIGGVLIAIICTGMFFTVRKMMFYNNFRNGAVINKKDEKAAFVVKSVRSFVKIGKEKDRLGSVRVPSVVNHMLNDNLAEIISIDGENWGEFPQEKYNNQFYVKCGYNSKDPKTGQASQRIKVVIIKDKNKVKVIGGKNNRGISWQKFSSGVLEDSKKKN